MLYLMIGVYVFVTAFTYVLIGLVFPRVFLRPSGRYAISKDRGVKKVQAKDGNGYVFVPATGNDKSIKEYALLKIDNMLYLKLKIDKSVSYIEYTVVLFNAKNKPFSTLTVCDEIAHAGFTEEISLPSETSYVAVYPENVDGRITGEGFKTNVSKDGIAAYVILSTLLFIAQSIFTPMFVAQFLDLTGGEFFYDYGVPNMMIIIVSGVVMLSLYFMTLTLNLYKRKKRPR